jgi:tetraacyldisaccharide 4'-kinase
VLSIGNLHWGGAGKTPLVAAVAAHLRDHGRAVAILTRGYGARGSGVRFASTGDGPLLGPETAGDEPVLLARELPGVAVVVSPDRHAAGTEALRRLDPPPDLFLLDDGFSHVRLARDLELLAFPAADPFAGGRLAPGGRLREPLDAAALADAVVLTGAAADSQGAALARALAPRGFRGAAFASRTVALAARWASGEPLEAPAPVLLVSAIARSRRFRELAAAAGFEVRAELALPDHHAYPEATLIELRRLWGEHSAAAVLTTSKDLVKLEGRLELPLAELPIEARPEPAFWSWLEGWLAALAAPAATPPGEP